MAVCTALAGGAGGIAALLFTYFRTRTWDTEAVCNGVLSGLVAITAGWWVQPTTDVPRTAPLRFAHPEERTFLLPHPKQHCLV